MLHRFCFVLLALAVCASFSEGQARFLNKTAKQWMNDLRAPGDAKMRRSAAFALGKLGRDGEAALPALQGLVKSDPDAGVREAAAFALGEIGQASLKADRADELVGVLRGALKDGQPLVRRSAAYALGCLANADAAEALEAAIADEHPGVRQNAAWALGRLASKTSVPALRKAVTDADPTVRRDGAAALGQFPAELVKPAVPDLVECCQVKDSEVRKAALAVLAKVVGPEDKAVAAGIRPLLDDADPEIQQNAAFVLANIGGEAGAAAVDFLVKALQSPDSQMRRQATVALSSIGAPAAKAVPGLTKMLADPDDEMRAYAAMALGGIGAGAEPAVPALLKIVSDRKEKPRVRLESATALHFIGDVPAVHKAVPALIKVLEDARDNALVTDPGKVLVRERVVWALRGLNKKLNDYPEAFTALEKAMKEPRTADNKMLQFDCAYMLGMYKAGAAPARTLDVLADYLKDDTVQIYVGRDQSVVGKGVESGAGDLRVRDTGMGDGRIMPVQALAVIASENKNLVTGRKDIMQQLRRIAGDRNLWSRLTSDTKKLLDFLER